MDKKYQTVTINDKASYSPEEMLFAIKHMSINQFIKTMQYDTSGKYDGIFIETKN